MSRSDFQPYLEWLHSNPEWVLFSVFIVALVESLAVVGIIVPGVLMLFLVAAAAGSLEISLSAVLIAGFIGAVIGDGLSFYLGHFFRDRLPDTWPFSRYPAALEKGTRFFERHGGKSVVGGRFIGPIRPIIPIVAGMLGMSQWRFFVFNILSAVAWSPAYLLPGYLTGSAASWALPQHFYQVVAIIVLGLGLIFIGFRYASQKLQRGSTWYDAIELYKQDSKLFRRLWIFLTRYHQPPREFPMASMALFLFSGLFYSVWSVLSLQWHPLKQLDQLLLEMSIAIRFHSFDQVLIGITLLGDEVFLYFSFAIFVAVFLLLRLPIAALHMVAAGIFTALITHGFKVWFAISRPEVVTQPLESYAYPSGHSSGATIFFGLLASFLAQGFSHAVRWRVYVIAALPILMIAMSRMLLGVHWFTDIVGGILLGLFVCGLTRTLYSRYTRKNIFTHRAQRYLLSSGVVSWLLSACVYIAIRFDEASSAYALMKP